MKTSTFPEVNIHLNKPPGMTDKECTGLDIFTNGEVCISLWKPTLRERLKLLSTGRIWLGILSGHTQPPVWVSVNRPFEKTVDPNKCQCKNGLGRPKNKCDECPR